MSTVILTYYRFDDSTIRSMINPCNNMGMYRNVRVAVDNKKNIKISSFSEDVEDVATLKCGYKNPILKHNAIIAPMVKYI